MNFLNLNHSGVRPFFLLCHSAARNRRSIRRPSTYALVSVEQNFMTLLARHELDFTAN
jgi:hypothetical protein